MKITPQENFPQKYLPPPKYITLKEYYKCAKENYAWSMSTIIKESFYQKSSFQAAT